MPEVEPLEALRGRQRLGIDELQLVAARHDERGVGLRADADPVEAPREGLGAVGLDRDLETARVERVDRLGIELAKIMVLQYSNNESSISIGESVRDEDGRRL